MSESNVEQTLVAALQHHEAGRLAEAERLYQQILALHPDAPDVWHLLGVAAGQGGRLDDAVAHINRAISLAPDNAEYQINLGKALMEKGQPGAATFAYYRAIELDPNQPAVYNALGSALRGDGRLEEAVAAYRKALKMEPGNASVQVNLGNALRDQGKLDEALAAYRQALELRPDFAGAQNNVANVLREQGQRDEAIVAYRAVIERHPGFAEAHFNLGGALEEKGEKEEAIVAYRQAVTLDPRHGEAQYRLANVLSDKGRFDEAIPAYQSVIALKPALVEAHNGLGNALLEAGRFDEAIAAFRQAIALKPAYDAAYNNLGNALRKQARLDEAIAAYRRALLFHPGSAITHNNLASALKDTGRFADAIESHRRAMAFAPKDAGLHSNLILALLLGREAFTILEEARLWNTRHAMSLAVPDKTYRNEPLPERRLRIGYVSPYFSSNHSVALFMMPLLSHHDHERFEIVCYSDVRRPDACTEQMRGYADLWRATAGMSDQQLAEQVEADQIDILVDLTMHMADNRLLVFARRPAPVQITWLGYPGTTGMAAIDYRLTDPYLDPPGTGDGDYTEPSLRLADTFWCYDPLTEKPDLQLPPAVKNGYVTFGCLNNFCKVNGEALQLWARVLKEVPGSKLLLLAGEGAHRGDTLETLRREGIAPERVTFVTHRPRAEYLQLYQDIDIGLDTFPYNGHTTSLDSYWMGVPVVTLVGKTVVGRAGLSQLNNLGLTQLVAPSPEDYVRIAAALAGDLEQLKGLRSTLRGRMQQSPLMDGPRFARSIETAYRQAWKTWCAGRK